MSSVCVCACMHEHVYVHVCKQVSVPPPPYLQDRRTRVTISTERRLNGKHFAYKHPDRGRCRVCSQKTNAATGKRKTQKLKISVVNVKFTFVLANALKISIPSLATEYRVLKF